jgi:hypothetical protein
LNSCPFRPENCGLIWGPRPNAHLKRKQGLLVQKPASPVSNMGFQGRNAPFFRNMADKNPVFTRKTRSSGTIAGFIGWQYFGHVGPTISSGNCRLPIPNQSHAISPKETQEKQKHFMRAYGVRFRSRGAGQPDSVDVAMPESAPAVSGSAPVTGSGFQTLGTAALVNGNGVVTG